MLATVTKSCHLVSGSCITSVVGQGLYAESEAPVLAGVREDISQDICGSLCGRS